jgi:argininosuccinate synthase
MKKQRKIVLAYSGVLETSIILKWVQEKYNAKVIAFCATLGKKSIKKKLLKTQKLLVYKK